MTITPLIEAPRLAKQFNVNKVYLKAECMNPTCSTKDKMAAVALSVLAEEDKFVLVLNSTGNSSTAFAYLVNMNPQFHATIFAGKNWINRLNYKDSKNIRIYCLDKSYDDLDRYTYLFADNNNLHVEGSFLSVACREGLKLAYGTCTK